MAVQYDSEKGWSTWLSKLKGEIPAVSQEAENFFNKMSKLKASLSSNVLNGMSDDAFNGFIKNNKLADKSLINFLKDSNYAEKNLANYQAYLQSAGKQTSAFASGVQKAGSVLKSLGATLASMAIMWAIGKGIELLVTTVDSIIHKAENAKEAMNNAVSEYDSAKSNVESVNNELTTTSDRITELQNKGPLTFVEKQELEDLRESTALLREQVELAESEERKAAREALDKTKESFDASYGGIDMSNEGVNKVYNRVTDDFSGWGSSLNALKNMTQLPVSMTTGNDLLGYYKLLKEARQELSEQDWSAEEKKRVSSNLDSLEKDIDEKYHSMLLDYQTYLSNYNKVGYDNLTTTDKQMYNFVASEIDFMQQFYEPDTYKENQFERIFDNDELLGKKDEMVEMAEAAGEAGVSIDELTQKYPGLSSAVEASGITMAEFVEQINALAKAKSPLEIMEEEFSNFQASSIDLINSLDSVNAALVNSVSGKGLSIEIDADTGEITGDIENIKAAYQSLNGYDADILFEKTANGVTLNRKALRLLQAQQESIQKDKFQEKQRELTQKLTQAYKEQAAAIDQGKDGSEQLATINSLNAQLQAVSELSAAYDGATSAYQKWVDAQSGGEEGDMYDAITSTALERGKELYDKGLVGTEEFRAITDLFAYGDQSTASVEELVAAYENAAPIISQFFTEGQEGAMSFADKLVELGYASKDAEGAYLFNPADTSKIAENLGIDVEAVEAVFRKIRDYGGDISFINADDIEKLDQYKTKASEIQEQLKQLSNEKVDLSAATNFDIGELNTVDELQSKAEEINELMLSPDVDATQLTWLQELVNLIQEKIDVLNGSSASPAITLDGVQGAYATANSLIERIQEINDINASTTLNIEVNGDTEVQSLAEQLADLPSEVKTSIGLEAEDDASAIIEKIKQDPGSITIPVKYQNVNNPDAGVDGETKTVTVNEVQGTTVSVEDETKTITVNYSLGSQTEPLDKTASVNYQTGEQEEPLDKPAIVNYDLGMQQSPISPVSATVNYKLGTVATPPSATVKVNYDTSAKPSSVNGTAHHLGTAPSIKGGSFSDGTLNVGARRTEDALVGELGPELIVRNNRFFTVGDDGAEMTHVQQGDIIFNHEQTKAILERGYVTSRGKLIGGNPAFAEGTAYKTGVNGSWKPNPGGSGSKANSNSSKSSSSSGSSNSINDATEAAEEFLEVIDWIETAIDRVERSIDRLSKFAEDAFDTFSNRNKNLVSEISEVNREINLQQQAYNRYMQEANSVGLSEAWANKVRNGEINIEEITDEDLNDQIQEFQEW